MGDATLDLLVEAAFTAGRAAMAHFRPGERTTAHVSFKPGDSPVSEADIAANDVLERVLRERHPANGWISEETASEDHRLDGDHVFIVDPIDGTRAFIAGDPQWSVSVALAHHGRPVAGVVHAPALGLTFMARAGGDAFLNGAPISCAPARSAAGARLAGPKPMLESLDRRLASPVVRMERVPSLALRLVRVAEGVFDAALASEGAHDWDVAAADVILAEAGGVLLGEGGSPLLYGGAVRRRGALAAGRPALAAELAGLIGLR